jgi:hypothetical protein
MRCRCVVAAVKRLISAMITAPNKNANNNIKDKVGIVNENDENNVGDNDDNIRTAYDEFRREAWLLACASRPEKHRRKTISNLYQSTFTLVRSRSVETREHCRLCRHYDAASRAAFRIRCGRRLVHFRPFAVRRFALRCNVSPHNGRLFDQCEGTRLAIASSRRTRHRRRYVLLGNAHMHR